MRYIDEGHTLWAHENSSGTIDAPFYKLWVSGSEYVDPQPVADYVVVPSEPVVPRAVDTLADLLKRNNVLTLDEARAVKNGR